MLNNDFTRKIDNDKSKIARQTYILGIHLYFIHTYCSYFDIYNRIKIKLT